jgi:hypothetical protein
MADWRRQLAELDRTTPDREAIRRRFDEGARFPDPIEARREPRIAVIVFAAVIAIAGMAFLFVTFRNYPRLSQPAVGGTGVGSTTAATAPPCPVTDSPVLGEDGVSFTTDCLAIVAHRPTTITGKTGGDGVDHALLVCSDKDCNEASQIAGTDVTTGPGPLELTLPGLEPGTYFFEDPVHPDTANGTLYVVDEPAAAATGSASPTAAAAPPCPVTDSPALGEAEVGSSFNNDCLAIVAHRPTTITMKAGGDGVEHSLLVCSDKDCNEASQIAGTDVKTGPALFVLNLPGLEPGTYFFEDPVHPDTANGTLYVVQGS